MLLLVSASYKQWTVYIYGAQSVRRSPLGETSYAVWVKMTTLAILKAKFFALGEWYSYAGLAVVANNGVSTLGFRDIPVKTSYPWFCLVLS